MTILTSPTSDARDPLIIKEIKFLAQGTATDLRTLQVKLTYVGLQTKPLATVVFTTFCHLIRMDWFLPLQKSNLHYNNDQIAVWNFTVTPDEMKRVVMTLIRVKALQEPDETEMPYLSLMVVLRDSRLGQSSFEAVLGRGSTKVVTIAIHDALDKDNGVGRKVMDLQRQLMFA